MVYRLIIRKSHSIARTPTDNPAVVCDQSILRTNCRCKPLSTPVPKTDNFLLPCMSITISLMFLDSPFHSRIPLWLAWEEKLDYSTYFHRKCRVYTTIRLAYNLRQITLPVPPVRYVEYFSPVYSLIKYQSKRQQKRKMTFFICYLELSQIKIL